jgi:hypothetical protein
MGFVSNIIGSLAVVIVPLLLLVVFLTVLGSLVGVLILRRGVNPRSEVYSLLDPSRASRQVASLPLWGGRASGGAVPAPPES